jgi:hypothetical protein
VEIVALVREGALDVIDLEVAGARMHDLMKKYADRPMDLPSITVWAATYGNRAGNDGFCRLPARERPTLAGTALIQPCPSAQPFS